MNYSEYFRSNAALPPHSGGHQDLSFMVMAEIKLRSVIVHTHIHLPYIYNI